MRIRLLIGAAGSLFVGAYDVDANSFEQEAQRRVPELGPFLLFGEKVLVRESEGVRVFDPTLRQGALLPFEGLWSGASSERHLFMATAGEMITFDTDLAVVGRLDLGLGGKTPHECMLIGPHLFALDNIVMPTFVLLLNTTNPRRLEVLSKTEITDTNCHLGAQFMDVGEHLWAVVQSTSGESGSKQYLHWFSADSGQTLGPRVELRAPSGAEDARRTGEEERSSPVWRYSDRITIGESGEISGWPLRIHGSSSTTPCWIVISCTAAGYHDRTFYLCRLSLAEGVATLTHFIPLSFSGRTGGVVVRSFRRWTIVLARVLMGGEKARVSSLRMIVVDNGADSRVLYDGEILSDAVNDKPPTFWDFQVWESNT